jgi:hypothetical protein
VRAGRLRSRARIWRPVETQDRLRQTVVSLEYVGRAWLEVRPPRRMLSTFGAGEQVEGAMEAEMRAGVDLRARDVLEIYAGPERGTTWRATTPPHRPGRGELVIGLEVYHAEVPAPPAEGEP